MADLLFLGMSLFSTLRASLSNSYLNIQCLGEIDVNVDSLKRIFQREISQVLCFLIKSLKTSEVLKVIRLPLSDLLSFEFF
jgi:hypothetical protein